MLKDEMLDFVKAMSDPDRLKIIGALSRGPCSASQLAETLGLPMRNLVDHLGMLEHVGILIARAAEKKQDELYELDAVFLERLAREQLEGRHPLPRISPDLEEETRRTLVKYLSPDGRIAQIPNSRTQPDKFRIILNYLISAFETGRNYTEKEVNDVLKRFNEDIAGLRRDLVDSGMLKRKRDGSKYWRTAEYDQRPE